MKRERIFATLFVVIVCTAIVGFSSGSTGASFTGSTSNPGQSWNTATVQAPATQNAAVSAVAGAVNLTWTASPSSPVGTQTRSYLVLRGPVGGPYAQVGTTATLAYTDTPPADGTYEWVIQTKIAQGAGFFTSVKSIVRSAKSDRTAPTATANAPAESDVAQIVVPASYSDGGTGVTSVALWAKAPGAPSFSLVTTNTFAASASGTSTFTYTAAAGIGTYSFYAVATDSAGNVQATPAGAQSTTLFDPTLELKRTTVNDGIDFDLIPAYTPVGADTTCALGSGQICTFATTAYTTGQSFAAGTSTASLYLQNGMATIALRSTSSASTGGVGPTTLTIAKPAGVASADLLIAAISFERGGDDTIAPPPGWTLVRQVNNTNTEGVAVYLKVAGGSEPASYAWTFSLSKSLSGGMLAYTGVDPTTPIDVENGQATAAGLTHATPSIVTTKANDLIVAIFASAAPATWTPPTGMTELIDVPEATGNSLEIATAGQAGPGATGVRTATASTDAPGVTEILALRPAQLSCTVTVQVLRNAVSLGSSTVAVTGPTASLKTVSITTSAATFATGDRLYLKVSAPVSTSCVGALRYDGASSISKLVHPQ